jgi:DinB superfamily
MPIVPDTKDWTWVLTRPCPECGFDSSSLPTDQIVPLLLTNAGGWLPVLDEAPAVLRRRPSDDRWSPLEYACHVRDVFRLYGERLQLMLTMDNPTYPNWDQDRSAVDGRYNEQDPAAVASELVLAADALAATFGTVEGDTWQRRGSRSDGADFTVATFGRYMIHDPIHHLHEVTVDVARLSSSDPG